jgi:hypothetical protein
MAWHFLEEDTEDLDLSYLRIDSHTSTATFSEKQGNTQCIPGRRDTDDSTIKVCQEDDQTQILLPAHVPVPMLVRGFHYLVGWDLDRDQEYYLTATIKSGRHRRKKKRQRMAYEKVLWIMLAIVIIIVGMVSLEFIHQGYNFFLKP